jgi:hypothetical protein
VNEQTRVSELNHVDDDAEQLELLSFSHQPIRAPRREVLGEVVMSEKWQALMAAEAPNLLDDCDEYAFRALVHQFPRPLAQRHATVAASFINWLGTNCGRGFLHNARRMCEKFANHREAYTAAWAIENTRHGGINRGMRVIEAALSTARYGGGNLIPADPTADDYEIVEHVVIWLAMKEGQEFLADCEAEIGKRLDAQREQRMHEFRVRAFKATKNKRDEWR